MFAWTVTHPMPWGRIAPAYDWRRLASWYIIGIVSHSCVLRRFAWHRASMLSSAPSRRSHRSPCAAHRRPIAVEAGAGRVRLLIRSPPSLGFVAYRFERHASDDRLDRRTVRLLDQTKLPTRDGLRRHHRRKADVGRDQAARRARRPAIGVAAAFGVYLGVRELHRRRRRCSSCARLNEVCDYLATSRPTAVNLFWALDRIQRVARRCRPGDRGSPPSQRRPRRAGRASSTNAWRCSRRTRRVCRAIGEHGLKLLQESLADPQSAAI